MLDICAGFDDDVHSRSAVLTIDDAAVDLEADAASTVSHDIGRLMQVDVAGHNLQLLFVAADHTLDLVRVSCRDHAEARDVIAALVDRWKRRTGQPFPPAWVQEHAVEWFKQQ